MSAVGRLLSKQVQDVFGDYALKSRESVENSPRGQTKPKPAASYIKQMQKEGVATEEMKDLGLLDDYDPKTGPLRNKRMTKQELLDDIDRRRAERLDSRGVYRGDIPPPMEEGETINPRFVAGKKIIKKSPPSQFESPEPVTGPQSKRITPMTSYNIYQQDIGDPDTYEEITYGLREGPEGKRAAKRTGEVSDRSVAGFYSRSPDELGLHFPERDQLFHLRLNRGKTTDGEGVTNLLELQSDIQQRAQKGTPLELEAEEARPFATAKPEYSDPNLPMVHNWEVLGVKEAVRRAVQNGDRYLAITPGREIGRAVGAVEVLSTGEPLKAILARSQSGKIDLIFTGLDIRKEFADLEVIDDLDIVNPKMSPDVEEILSGVGYEEYLNNPMEFSGYLDDIENARFENNLSILARAMVTVQFNDFGYKTLSDEGIQYADKLVEDFIDSLIDYGIDVGGEVEDFVAEITEDPLQVYALVLPESIIDKMLTIRSSLEDTEAIADDVLQRMYTDEEVAKALNINVGEVRRLTDSGETVEITPEMEFGGQGVIDFYDKQLISEKRLQKYGAPLVEIEQTRPDGTTVTTNALDLKTFIDEKKKNKKAKIPYSLYSAVLGIPLAGKLGSTALSQEQTTNKEPLEMKSGGDVDPVSGNEIPPGSTAEEVRDDIPAMLSEGEFVFPADVVRYIGLDKLMKLRQQAKEGLAKMEKMGQLSNPEEATLPDDTPHEPLELQTGGSVAPRADIPTPTYMQPGSVSSRPPVFSGVQRGAPQSASVQSTSVYNPSQFQQQAPIVNTGGFTPQTQFSPPVQQRPTQAPLSYEMRRYTNEMGNVIYIPVVNGQPQFQIPEGYTFQPRIEGIRDDAITAVGGDPNATPADTPAKVQSVVSDPDDDGATGEGRNRGGGRAPEDPIMGIAKGFAEANPQNSSLQEAINKHNQAQIKGIAATGLALASGNPLGAVVSLGMMKYKQDKYKQDAFNQLPTEVQNILQVTTGKGKEFVDTGGEFTNEEAQKVYTESVAAGASPALATALAVQTGAFRGEGFGEGEGRDLGEVEKTVAEGSGTKIGSAQTAMLTEQLSGFTIEELRDYYSEDDDAPTQDTSGSVYPVTETRTPIDFPSVRSEPDKLPPEGAGTDDSAVEDLRRALAEEEARREKEKEIARLVEEEERERAREEEEAAKEAAREAQLEKERKARAEREAAEAAARAAREAERKRKEAYESDGPSSDDSISDDDFGGADPGDPDDPDDDWD